MVSVVPGALGYHSESCIGKACLGSWWWLVTVIVSLQPFGGGGGWYCTIISIYSISTYATGQACCLEARVFMLAGCGSQEFWGLGLRV